MDLVPFPLAVQYQPVPRPGPSAPGGRRGVIMRMVTRLKWLSYRLFGWPKPKVLWRFLGFKTVILNSDWVIGVRKVDWLEVGPKLGPRLADTYPAPAPVQARPASTGPGGGTAQPGGTVHSGGTVSCAAYPKDD